MTLTRRTALKLALTLIAAFVGWIGLTTMAKRARLADAGPPTELVSDEPPDSTLAGDTGPGRALVRTDTVPTIAGERATIADYGTAMEWATKLIGLAVALAGFFGLAVAGSGKSVAAEKRARAVEGGAAGVLAGATLLGVGGWPVPAALGVLVTAGAVERGVVALRGHSQSAKTRQ
jgi:hypothetical protein